MPIRTYYSSETESLIGTLISQIQGDQTSSINTPFGRTHVLVPNSGMQRYLELKIAEEFGICSHIDISYIGQLVSKTYRVLLDNASPSRLDARLLTFALLRLWSEKVSPIDSAFGKLNAQYQQPRQRYLWANKIAQLLCRYIDERPEIIDLWQDGKLSTHHTHESWQCEIFKSLFSALGITHTSRLCLQERFIEALATETTHDLPNIVHVFGFHSIPASQLTDLMAIGQATQVNFYTFNPCVAYWQDIVPEKIKMRLEMTDADETELLSVGHPLLASWGQSGKFYIEALDNHESYNLDEMVGMDAPKSVLGWLQNDIRELTDEETDLTELFKKEVIKHEGNKGFKPYSLTLNACANPRREVEVLYDNLCQLFENESLNPADVLVIVPKLGDYAPHIQAVFSRSPAAINNVPYSLANQSSAESDPDVQAFLSLLNLLNGDFQAQLLFECLSEARIQEKLDISQGQLDVLRNWFVESRFSLHFYDSSDGQNSSLEKLLDSLLLASVGGEGSVLDKRHASNLYNGGQLEPLTQLCELWQRFIPFTSLKNKHLTLRAWRDKLRDLTESFLPLRHSMDDWINDWYDTLAELDDETTYDFSTLREDFSAILKNDTLYGPFLSGGVSFCAVVPMRSIPAKMIAILGLDSNFPTVSAKDPLDLRLDKPLWSDRNPHKEQQYFFLETLMAAREILYLSHVGLSEKTGEKIPPSALVCELFGYIDRKLTAFGKRVTTHYPLQGFVGDFSYQALYATPELRASNKSTPESVDPTLLPDMLTVKGLAGILLEPLTAFWRYNLGAELLDELVHPLPEYEFIATEDGLEKWHYKQSALNMSLHENENKKTDDIENLKQRNLYAPQVISEALLTSANDMIQPMFNVLNELNLEAHPTEINTQLKIAFCEQSIYLRMQAKRYQVHGLVAYHVGSLNVKKLLETWILHVIYHASHDTNFCQSQLLTLDKGKVTKTVLKAFDSRKNALQVLDDLLNLVHKIIQQPYSVQLNLSGTKDETVMHYEAVDYPLYSQIANVDDALVVALQDIWGGVDSVLKTQCKINKK